MARTKGSKKKPAKATKKRDFALVHPKNAPGSGVPSNYLYGKSSQGSKKSPLKRKSHSVVSRTGVATNRNIPIKVKLHSNYTNKPVPWCKNVDNCGNKKRHNKLSRTLNGYSVSESSLHHLNKEMAHFVEYVRLTPAERESREYLIRNIKSVCKDLFGIDEQLCQTFGSFAVPGVCTFSSDIDMAIWGVVAKDESDDERDTSTTKIDLNRKRSISLAESEGSLSEVEEKLHPSVQQQDHPNRKKQERILQWKNAINHALETSLSETFKAKERRDTGNDSQQGQKSNHGDEEVQELFVLDRRGIDEVEVEKDTANFQPDQEVDGEKSYVDHRYDDSSKRDSTDEDDCDDADKLEALWSRAKQEEGEFGCRSKMGGHLILDNNSENDDEVEDDEPYSAINARRPRGQSMVSLSSATTCSGADGFDDSGMEVSYTVSKMTTSNFNSGPTGRNRTAVVNALYKIAKRMKPYATTLHVRKKAKVPIINFQSHFGFEVDIAMGGHNGTDTSSYASIQVSRFKCFPAIVVLLKMLLSEHNLDKPFTGGIGSFSLYVLVAHHLEEHLLEGGNDDAAEALITFFFRYGARRQNFARMESSSCTLLSQEVMVSTYDGGSTDLSSSYQIDSIVKLFELCHRALIKKLSGELRQGESILQYILNPFKLEIGRIQARQQASIRLNAEREGRSCLSLIDPIPFVNVRAPQSIERKKNFMVSDRNAEKLIRSYGRKVGEFFPERGQDKRKRGQAGEAGVFDVLFGAGKAPAEFPPLEASNQPKGKKLKLKGKASSKKRRKSC
ncbi:hypothetical protein IV203_029109 [Nitzschia inconspicua]|uniref:Uncharacterized protein n=1 Tax=Nitzschia inconspicua TaxID=303405 RepID=A0A9K3LQ05_9STRA|nr:hypothetical protein IV203_029109 [Nitzschia inconspicua]